MNWSTSQTWTIKEWRYYNPVYNRHSLVKDTLIEMDGRRLRIELAVDISADTKPNEIIRDDQNREALINEALRTAMQASDPDISLKIAIEYLGKALDKADRLAAESAVRMSHEEVFGNLRRKINAQ